MTPNNDEDNYAFENTRKGGESEPDLFKKGTFANKLNVVESFNPAQEVLSPKTFKTNIPAQAPVGPVVCNPNTVISQKRVSL